jgi:hypothetical protein
MEEVRLVVEKGKTQGRTFQLRSEETVIGRRQDCDLRIASSEVSRRHCLLSLQDGFVRVEDLDSVNGTFINGKRVQGKHILRPGDRLDVGPVRFVVEYELTQEALDRLEQEAAGATTSDSVMEVVPLTEDDEATTAYVVGDKDEEPLEALPMDEETELAAVQPAGDEDLPEAAPATSEDDEPIPVLDEFDEGADWELPQSHELRNLLSQIDPEPRQKPNPE